MIAGVVFVDMLGLAIILPSLPFFVLKLGASGTELGLILTSYSLMQMAAAPVLGRLSDRVGRRNLLLISLAGSSVSFTLTAFADNIAQVVLARGLAGLCGGSIAVAYAFVADTTDRDHRTRAMGWVGMGVGMAFTIGPIIGALLAPHGFATVCLSGSALATVNLFVAWFILPRPARPPLVSAQDSTDTGAAVQRRPDASSKARFTIIALIAAGGVLTASFVTMETTISLLTEARYSYDATAVGWLLAAAGLAMMALHAVIASGALGRFSDGTITVASATVAAVCLGAIPSAPEAGVVLAVLALSASYGAFGVAQMSLVSQLGSKGAIGARMGWAQASNAAGRTFGPLAAGGLFDLRNALPFVAASALSGMAAAAVFVAGKVITARRYPPSEAPTTRHQPGSVCD